MCVCVCVWGHHVVYFLQDTYILYLENYLLAETWLKPVALDSLYQALANFLLFAKHIGRSMQSIEGHYSFHHWILYCCIERSWWGSIQYLNKE